MKYTGLSKRKNCRLTLQAKPQGKASNQGTIVNASAEKAHWDRFANVAIVNAYNRSTDDFCFSISTIICLKIHRMVCLSGLFSQICPKRGFGFSSNTYRPTMLYPETDSRFLTAMPPPPPPPQPDRYSNSSAKGLTAP